MPHGLFLGSALATQDRLSVSSPKAQNGEKEFDDAPPRSSHFGPSRVIVVLKESICALFRKPSPSEYSTAANSHTDHENRPYAFVKAHVYHGTVDLVINLMFIAVAINSMSVDVLLVSLHQVIIKIITGS